jgi:hypothetical protein
VDAAAPAAPPPQQPLLPPPRRRLSGSYTVIDPSTLEAIRSGKADDCSDRKAGHRQCARQRNRPAGSNELYTAYPSKELEEFERNNPVRRGLLVEYFLELVCDLFLDPAKCVSNSAGFERFLKEFGGRADGNGDTDAQDDNDVD